MPSGGASERGLLSEWGPVTSRMRPVLRVLAVVVSLLAITVLVGIVVVRLPLPRRSGRDRLPGLTAPATVTFDRRGVPHVRAATETDAYRVLGWLHAGDRFFQMELRRRAASGRLAEVAGEALVPLDLESRRVGHARAAARDLSALSAGARAAVDAYAEGINAYLARGARPLELVALGDDPEPWSAADTLAFSRYMIAGLSDAPAIKVRRLVSLGVLESTDGTAIFDGSTGKAGGPAGSNAWALGGSRTASGRPMLANDPHLGVEFPGVWYAAHLTTDDGLDVAGLTLPGVPGIAIGHNGRIAWGITMAQVDDADLFRETIDAGSKAYLREGRFVPLEARTETIRIRGKDARDVVFYATDHGTLLGGFREDGALEAVALASAIPGMVDHLEPFRLAGRATTPEDLSRAWSSYRGSAFNVCWASMDGHIGLRLAGAIPARSRSASEGDLATEEWVGIVPDPELPRLEDPPDGIVASANDDWSESGRTLPFRGFYATNDRVDRIRTLLSGEHDATAADMNALQNDVLSPYAVRVVRNLSRLSGLGGEAARARDILAAWDGEARTLGPSRLFYAFLSDLASRRKLRGWKAVEEETATVSPEQDGPIAQSLGAALERVEREDGKDPSHWSWGAVHTLRYEHPLSSQIPPALGYLRRWLDVGPIGMPGEVHTIDVQAFTLGREPRIGHIPSARLVVDLGNVDASTLVLPLGQSGQFQDVHYDDQVHAWSRGRTFPFPFTRKAVDAAAVSVLRLSP